MTLGNMRQNGARWISLTCILPCAHRRDILVDHLGDDVLVASIGRRYRCSACGRRGPESRPAWHVKDGGLAFNQFANVPR